MSVTSKLDVADRVAVPVQEATDLAADLFRAAGCSRNIAHEVASHLVEADQCGVESHGMVRVLQYVKELRGGTMRATAEPVISRQSPNRLSIDAGGGVGIPAMRLCVTEAAAAAKQVGLAACVLRGAGHTGRLGAFAEEAAAMGCLTIIIGGGNRKTWRMVAPYGGTEPLLPTNPYCIGIPGGAQGPVILDFATSQIAGGWIYAARAAGVPLPEGAVIDRHGRPTRDPADYFAGGAILPKGAQMGSGLALIGELIGEAMLGPVTKGEINWLVLAVDCATYRDGTAMQSAAEEILSELRACRPAAGHDRVEIPGERERARAAGASHLYLPSRIWAEITALAEALNLPQSHKDTRTGF